MKRVALLLILSLSGCGCTLHAEGEGPVYGPPAPPFTIPKELKHCPGRVEHPAEPPVPRTVEALSAWAYALDDALVRSEKRGDACRYRLEQLIDWINQNMEGETQ